MIYLLPVIPETPVLPEIPETPETPEIPETPVLPETPEIPSEPEKPSLPETDKPDNEVEVNKLAYEVFELVNQERAKAGLKALEMDTNLQKAADLRAQEISKKFSHTRPDGSSFSTVLGEFGIKYKKSGENIAYGYNTAEKVMNAWMNSQGHRANILNSDFEKIGIGVYTDSNGTVYWQQTFIK